MGGASGPDLGVPVKLRESPSGRYVELAPTPPVITLLGGAIADGTVIDTDEEVDLLVTVPAGRLVLNATSNIGIPDGADETRLALYVEIDGNVVAGSECSTSTNRNSMTYDPWPSTAALTVMLELEEETEIRIALNRSSGAGSAFALKPGALQWTGVHQAAT